MSNAAPAARPRVPNFSSGPCAKRPGWNLKNLADAPLGRSVPLAGIARFAFYEAAKRAFAVVHVGDPRPYGCFLLRKGVIAGEPASFT